MLGSIAGGIAIFLIGMTLLADGVKAAAGGALRRTLTRLTGGAFRAFVSGAGITAVVQSSTVTTLATIGFVSAGVLTFSQAIGLIVGANVGTTSTGWLVSMLGLHVNVTAFAVPLVAAGALLRLLGHGRTASSGLAIAGFGLLFIGIGWMQSGLQLLQDSLDLSAYTVSGPAGGLVLFAIGIAMTVVMQSSSAAVATTLTALHVGAISLPQAAVLVIGQNVGTTATAAMAMIGASTPARRTGVAHILFNVITAAAALLLLPVVIPLALRAQSATHASGAVIIATFHTTFNLFGAALVLPFADRFARLITRLVPTRGPQLTSRLDPSAAVVGSIAVETARITVIEIASLLRSVMLDILGGAFGRRGPVDQLDTCDQALDETRRFLASVRSPVDSHADHARHVAVLHAVDHLERIVGLARAPWPRETLACTPVVAAAADMLTESLTRVTDETDAGTIASTAETAAGNIADSRRLERPRILQLTASGDLDPDTAIECLDALRWVENLAYHWWRAAHHLHTQPADDRPGGDAMAADGAR